MMLQPAQVIATEVLIIGGGGAGLRAAIEARRGGAEVLLVSKSRAGYGNNTAIAGGAFAAATGWRDPQDNPEAHFRDTVIGGRFVNDQTLVEVMARGGGQQVLDLEEFGVHFRKAEGKIWIALAPGHSHPRHVYGDNRIGMDFSLPLRDYAQKAGARLVEGVLVTRLLQAGERVVGAVGINPKGEVLVFTAAATVLACGGLGQLFLNTNNAAGTTGDGYALTYQAGLPLQDMEFVQYYPTALGERGSRNLLYEAFVARSGARLQNSSGEDILEKYGINDPIVMTRDRLTRAIMGEILAGRGIEGRVIMDLASVPADHLARLLPLLPRESRERRQFLVAPTAHFAMGGVKIDGYCHTRREGLFACGEMCAGVHGANRLAGNALTEVFVFGSIAGREAAAAVRGTRPQPPPEGEIAREVERLKIGAEGQGGTGVEEVRHALKQAMWLKAGIIRSQSSLEAALAEISSLQEALPTARCGNARELMKLVEAEHMLTVAEMVCRAALRRTESRGAHYRSDFPEEDNAEWLNNILIHNQEGTMEISPVPVELAKLSP